MVFEIRNTRVIYDSYIYAGRDKIYGPIKIVCNV